MCASAGVAALILYLACLPPSVTGEDSGELIAAAYTLGIPHPPGYPLWTLLGYAATHALPFGSIAWRAAALSAAFGALTVWLLAELVLHLFSRRDVAWVSAMALALSREFWEQSIVAEIYTLGAFLVLLAVSLILAWHRWRHRAMLYAAAAAAGLAGAHYTLNLLLLPVLFGFVFATDIRPRRARTYALAALCALPGWLLYVYLPVRSAMDPPVDWGDPTSPARFWDVISRGQYAHLLASAPRTWANFSAQSVEFSRILADQFTPWLGALALPGVAALWLRDRAAGAFLTALFVLFAIGGIVVPNFPLEYHWIWVNTPYWIPAYLIAAVFVAAALDWLLREVKWPRNVPAITAAILLTSLAVWNGPHNYRRGDTTVMNYASDVLDTFAPDAIYFGGGDHTVFPLMYLQVVEGRRPDVLIANRYGYPSAELYAIAGEIPPATRPRDAEEDRLFARALESDRPVYSATPRPSATRHEVYEGLLYRYVRADEAYDTRTEWPGYHQPIRASSLARGDWSNELVEHEYWAALGRRLLRSGDPDSGVEFLTHAATLIHEDKSALNNLGLACAKEGLLEDAAGFFERALETDPAFVPALLNLARCRIELGETTTALALVARAAEAGADPDAVRQMHIAASNSAAGAERRDEKLD